MVGIGAMKGRLKQLELRRGEVLKTIKDLQREVSEIERDARILAEAISEAEPPKDKKPAASSAEEVK